ncbi:hypothetical protein ACCAA_670059 [Candidatus Accumulibacter aalborgensis]|uniref:Uncharacterized protein n=1 Tax=Candidatus Accumulibacter aalborgensis TaxID=1860102 RepID=A0A1A8XWP0_9PROT|nr:hypothetical protein ACCAA_670059 [Candidatus Accumulibacter aalborgensis]
MPAVREALLPALPFHAFRVLPGARAGVLQTELDESLNARDTSAEAAGIASVLLSLRDPLSRSTESGPAKK